MSSTTEKGTDLENRVLAVYQQLGASRAIRDVRIAGHQVDVYIELIGVDGALTRVAVECKNYAQRVGLNEATIAAQKLVAIRQLGEVDAVTIVSEMGFTPDAIEVCQKFNVRAVTFFDLSKNLADFEPYLRNAVAQYEASRIFSEGLYRRLGATSEEGDAVGFADEFLMRHFTAGENLILLLGDYGTGKTTLAERIFWDASRRHLASPATQRIPLFIPLKRYRKEINLRSLVTDLLLHEYGVRIRDYYTVQRLNDDGRLFLILDAFDEMASGADEAEVIANFREILRLVVPKANVLLTCRTHFFKDQHQMYRAHHGTSLYQDMEAGVKRLKLCYLAAYTPDDINSLVTQYCGSRASLYRNVIEGTYNLSELAPHPILLDMILRTAPDQLAKGTVSTAADLYELYTGFWLDRDDWRSHMNHEQRAFFMEELALNLQLT